MKFYHTATQEDYDALMIELDNQGVVWGIKRDKPTERSFWDVYKENTFLIIEGCSLSYGSLKGKYRERHSEWPLIEYKAKGEIMNEKQFKQLAHDLVVEIISTIGTFSLKLDVSDDDLAKTQKLVKKFDETLTEFIDSRKPKFKVGDYVVREYSDETYIGEVNDIKENHAVCCSYETVNDVICIDEIFNLENIRHATPEEIAEYKAALNFHEHGRKPFEVKEGDILRDNKGNILINGENILRDGFPKNLKTHYFTSGRYTFLKTAEEVNEWLENK